MLLLQEGERVIGEDVCHIAGNLLTMAVVVNLGIQIDALAFDADPIIDPWPWIIIEPHVPFADESRIVAGVVQESRKGDELVALRVASGVIYDAVLVRVLPGEKAGATGRAKR